MKPINYIGGSSAAIRAVCESGDFQLRTALLPSHVMSAEFENFLRDKDVPFHVFSDREALFRQISLYEKCSVFLIYKLDTIIKQELIDLYSFFNIPLGNLRTNRGARPDIWTILEGHQETAVTLHKIDADIDAGTVVAEKDMAVSQNEDPPRVRQRMEGHFPEILSALRAYLEGGRPGYTVPKGPYKRRIRETDFTIDLARDSLDVIDRKIRSQREYNGAVLWINGHKYYVRSCALAGPGDTIENRATENPPSRIGDQRILVKAGVHTLEFR